MGLLQTVMINEDVSWLLVVWHILLLTLEVNLHCYRLADSFRVLEKECTSLEHPTPGLSGEGAAEPWSICTPLRLWLCLWYQNTRLWEQSSPWEWQKDLEAAWITIRLCFKVLWKWLWAFLFAQKAAGPSTVLQSLNICRWCDYMLLLKHIVYLLCILSGFTQIIVPVPESTRSETENKGFTQGLETALKVQYRWGPKLLLVTLSVWGCCYWLW